MEFVEWLNSLPQKQIGEFLTVFEWKKLWLLQVWKTEAREVMRYHHYIVGMALK